MALIADHPILPTRYERMYSRFWNSGIGVWGGRTSTTCPSLIRQPLAIRIVPLTAITCFDDDSKGQMQR